jgi:hypothetical protein
MTDWVPVLIVALIVVCATAYLLLIKWIAAAVATSREDHRSWGREPAPGHRHIACESDGRADNH